MSDILATFSFVNDTIEELKTQEVNKVQIVLSVEDLVISISIDGSFYHFIEDLEIF